MTPFRPIKMSREISDRHRREAEERGEVYYQHWSFMDNLEWCEGSQTKRQYIQL